MTANLAVASVDKAATDADPADLDTPADYSPGN
jgi:hypothetical protein